MVGSFGSFTAMTPSVPRTVSHTKTTQQSQDTSNIDWHIVIIILAVFFGAVIIVSVILYKTGFFDEKPSRTSMAFHR